MADFVCQFLTSRTWSVYPFVPPLFSLVFSLLFLPLYDRVLDDNLKIFLRGKKAEDKFDEINQILKGRGLQIAYLTEIPVFLVSAVTTVQSNHPRLLIAITGAALLIVLLTSPKVFLSSPTYIAGTKFPEKERTGWTWRLLAKADLTQAELYSLLLAGLNVVLLIVIAISLPPK